MIARVLLVGGVALVTAGLLLPDLRGDVDELQQRVGDLEERVRQLEARVVRPTDDRSSEAATGAALVLSRLGALEASLGIAADVERSPADRAWRAGVLAAASQSYLFATQVAGNGGYLRPDERPKLVSQERRREQAGVLAEAAYGAAGTGAAFRALEAGVRELFVPWVRRARGNAVDVDAIADKLLGQWRAACLPIVREKLDQGAAWRDEIRAQDEPPSDIENGR